MAGFVPASFNINDKRQRTVTFSRPKRPIDKVIKVVSHVGVDDNEDSTTIVTSTFPSTIVGLRWNLAFHQQAGTGVCEYVWCIVVLGQGETLDTLTFADGVTLYEPEKNCLVWGFGTLLSGASGSQINMVEGSTKTMRKMMIGDQIVFISKSGATDTMTVHGGVQLFQKL